MATDGGGMTMDDEPTCHDGGEHRWVGGGDYGGSPPTICGDCGMDIEDDDAPSATHDPNQCAECGDNLDLNGFCWHCDL